VWYELPKFPKGITAKISYILGNDRLKPPIEKFPNLFITLALKNMPSIVYHSPMLQF